MDELISCILLTGELTFGYSTSTASTFPYRATVKVWDIREQSRIEYTGHGATLFEAAFNAHANAVAVRAVSYSGGAE